MIYGIKFIIYYKMNREIIEIYTNIHRLDKGEYIEKLLREYGKDFKWIILIIRIYLEL
jgi:hypothetical protein